MSVKGFHNISLGIGESREKDVKRKLLGILDLGEMIEAA